MADALQKFTLKRKYSAMLSDIDWALSLRSNDCPPMRCQSKTTEGKMHVHRWCLCQRSRPRINTTYHKEALRGSGSHYKLTWNTS